MKEKLREAKKLSEKKMYKESIDILLNFDTKNASNKVIILKNLLLAENFYNVLDFNNVINCSNKILEIDSSNELASLLKYLSYVSLKDFNKAFLEIFNFLNKNKANLYKDTLKELLFDIESNVINDKKIIEAIIYLAKKNEINGNGTD